MKCMQKMNVIAKISCNFECDVVTLKLRKAYLNAVTYNTPVLLRMKYWTVWCIERYSMSTCTGVRYKLLKTVRFFLAHPVVIYNRRSFATNGPLMGNYSRRICYKFAEKCVHDIHCKRTAIIADCCRYRESTAPPQFVKRTAVCITNVAYVYRLQALCVTHDTNA